MVYGAYAQTRIHSSFTYQTPKDMLRLHDLTADLLCLPVGRSSLYLLAVSSNVINKGDAVYAIYSASNDIYTEGIFSLSPPVFGKDQNTARAPVQEF